MYITVYRASASNASTAQYCFTNSIAVCLSVCLSNAGTVSKRMDTSSYFLIFWQGHHSIFSPASLQNFKGNPSLGALNIPGWEIFFKYCHISRNGTKWTQLLWNINRKSQVADRLVLVAVTLSAPEGRDVRSKNILAYLCNYPRTVWPRMIDFDMVTQREEHISRGSATSTFHTQCPPKMFGTPTYAETAWPTATKCGTVTHAASSVLLGVSLAPILRAGPQRPLNF